MNRKFLTDAIAEAQTIKESAIANARLALEESFTPKLKEMLSTKINELETEENLEEVEVQEVEMDKEEIELDEVADEAPETVVAEVEDEKDEEAEEELLDLSTMTSEDLEAEIAKVVTDMISNDELDLSGTEDEVTDELADDEDLDLEIEDDTEEEISEEVANEIKKVEDDAIKENEGLKKELFEAYKAVSTLKKSLNEINLLNAKLLYTNKIFKAKNLNEGEKTKVLGAFDKAKTISEAKLVYSTLTEGLSKPKTPVANITKHIGLASKSMGTIKESVEKPILEVSEQYLRMQKLAGII